MGTHMKTTIDISNSLFQETRRYAGQQKMTFREIVETALRNLLKAHKSSKRKVFRLQKRSFGKGGLVAGLVEGDWSAIREKIYEGRGG